MTTPIRFGILGSGGVAAGFATALATVEGTLLAAVASRRPERSASFAARHGALRVHQSYDDLVGDPEIDVVYVATPNHRHAEDMLACLHHGKHVVCEKPFATTADEARRVVGIARSRRLFCMEAMWMRFIPAVQRAAGLVRSGAIGEVVTLHADFSHPVVIDRASRLFDPVQGGGALLDLGVYTVSLAEMLLGEPIDVVGRLTFGTTGVDEHASVVATYRGGATALLTCSLTSRGPNHAVIAGTTGRIVLPGPICAPIEMMVEPMTPAPASLDRQERFASRIRDLAVTNPRLGRSVRRLRRLGRVVANRSQRSSWPLDVNGYEYELREVVRCLQHGLLESPVMPLDATLRVLTTMDLARRAERC